MPANLVSSTYQTLPDKFLNHKVERCSGGYSKVRLTGLTAGNATGERLPVFVIRNSAKQRCLSAIKSLPCRYLSQNKELDRWLSVYPMGKGTSPKICSPRRDITLIVDNCPAHPIVDVLKAIKLIFLPPNTISKTQPKDHGVIRSLKAFYHHSIIKRYITSIDGGRSPTKANILEFMTLLTAAWECISRITLVNCFRKAGINSESQARSQSDDDDPFRLLAAHLEEFHDRCESPIDFK